MKSASVSILAFGKLCEIRENASKHQYALYCDESPVILMQTTLYFIFVKTFLHVACSKHVISQRENLCYLHIFWVEHAPTFISFENCLIFETAMREKLRTQS